MRNNISSLLSLTGLVLVSSAAVASEVSISNTFTSGTPARAEEVNQNFSDVKTAVDDNHNRLTANVAATASNATEILNNAAAISGNTDGIASNAATISNLNSSVNTNTANIGNLISSVSANTAGIGNLDSSVSTNTADIGNLSASISTNTADIDALNASVTANTDAVGINATAIDSNRAAIDSNTARITANETTVSSINQAVSIYDGSDTRLGRYLGVAQQIQVPYSKLVHQGTVVWMLSETGYLFALERWYSPVTPYLRGIDYFQVPTTADDFVISTAKIYYPSNNCTGQEYLSANQIDAIAYTGFSPVISVRGGIAFRTLGMSGTATVNYLPKGAGAIPIAYESSRDMDSTTCTQSSPTLLESALAISANDPTITGVGDNVVYVSPLKFGY